MTTLVTGATGFIGGNLARRLASRGEHVRALVRPAANDLVIRDAAVKQCPGNLLDVESLRRAVKGCETVYHCAATYSFWAKRPSDIYDTNVAGTKHLLDAARSAGVRRVVFTSSVSTVGLPDGVGDDRGELGSEEIPANPSHLIGNYKQSKYAAEQIALDANGDDLEVVVVNPCAPVGKWDVKPTPTGRIPLDFARGRIPGYLDTGMNLVDVADVAEGHILAMERGRPGERYILGHRNLTLRQVFGMLAEITGPRAHAFGSHIGSSWARLTAINGWKAAYCAASRQSVEGIKVARHPMYVSCRKAVTRVGNPTEPGGKRPGESRRLVRRPWVPAGSLLTMVLLSCHTDADKIIGRHGRGTTAGAILDEAIGRLQDHFRCIQNDLGYWWGELESNNTMEANT